MRKRTIGIVAAAIVGSGIVIGAAGSHSTPAATSAPAVVSSPTPTHSAAPRTVATFSGSGDENTPRFTVPDTWKLVYRFDCSSFGYAGNFVVDEDGGSDFNLSVNDLARAKHGTTWAYGDAGTHYLAISSECSWHAKVVVP